MTIDEAISIMNVIVHMLEPQYDTDRIEEAVEMAIKALKQQPTDAVDRVTIKEYISSCEVTHPKIGRWITWKEAGNDIPSETRFECSVCHDAAQTLCNGLDLLSTYCPNCGAKMQEVKDES